MGYAADPATDVVRRPDWPVFECWIYAYPEVASYSPSRAHWYEDFRYITTLYS